MTAEKLKEILTKHRKWLNGKSGGEIADLRGANLRGADLRGANLRGSNLREADLREADLRGSNLRGSNLREADLRGADLFGADLRGANLSGANLSGADLRGANLSGATLCGANLYRATLCGANLYRATLCGANLFGADLFGANLFGADLFGADEIRRGVKLKEPMIGWKKCKRDVIVKLEIPRGAIVFSINNSKCRTDKAKVIEIVGADRAYSAYKFFSYYVGDVIEVFNFNCEYNDECAEGIHFFRTREEAEEY